MLDGVSEGQRHQRLYDDLRKKLLDLSRRNPMLNYKHRAGSRRQLRIVHTNLEAAFGELTAKQKELLFAPLPEPDDIPEDELTDTFKAALGHAKSTDLDYLTRLAALDGVARQDDASLTKLERWLRDHIRQQLELPPRPGRQEFNLIEHARQKGIDPNYELSSTPPKDASIARRLQSMFFADELDLRLARIAADARLSSRKPVFLRCSWLSVSCAGINQTTVMSRTLHPYYCYRYKLPSDYKAAGPSTASRQPLRRRKLI